MIALVTNPSAREHESQVRDQARREINFEIGDVGIFNGLKNFGASAISSSISVKNSRNWFVFSQCDVYVLGVYAGNTLGAFGSVWVFWEE